MVKGFYAVLSWIDYLVYSLVSTLLSVNIDIAGEEIITPEHITDIANRIYIVVGVLMLFKVVISAIQFMVNPDSFDDKEKGAVGLLKKTAICFAMIVFAPAVFNFMIAMQTTIIKAVPKVVFGSESEESDSQSETEQMAFTVLSAFIEENKEGKNPGKGSIGEGKIIHDLKSFKDHASDGCPEWFDFDVSKCHYNYMIIISTAAGIFLCYVLLSMTLDVAIRTIKFSIIRVLAPIPISSYIFSKDKLNKFVKTTLTVYCDLFIRLLVIYFIIFAVQEVVAPDGVLEKLLKNAPGDKGWFYNALVIIAIIGGLFMFAKNAPKFITELLGLPDIGAGDMKDMFKPAWQRNGALGAVGGMFTAGAGNMINKYRASKSAGDSFGKRLRKSLTSGVAGAASAGFHGGLAAMQGKSTKEVNDAGYRRAIKARQNRDLDRLNNIGWRDRAKVRFTDALGIDTAASLAEGKQKAYSTLHQDVGNYKKAVLGRIIKRADVSMRTDVKKGSALDQLGTLLDQNSAAIAASGNADLISIASRFQKDAATGAWKLKAGATLSYHDLAAIHADATQAGIGSIAGVTGENGALTLFAQKELFSDSMAGKIQSTNGGLIDELNVGSGSTHSDISTAVAAAQQHLAENAVPLGKPADELQAWFEGKSAAHAGKDFANMDDTYQTASANLSTQMSTGATGSEAAARASLERRNANKDKK